MQYPWTGSYWTTRRFGILYEVQFRWCPHAHPKPLHTLFPGWDTSTMSRMWWSYHGGSCRANGFYIAHIWWPLPRILPQQFAVPDRCICQATSFKLQSLCASQKYSASSFGERRTHKNTKVVVPDRSLTVETGTRTTVYRLVTVVVHWGKTMTRAHYVCYAFGEKGVTEHNDKTVQNDLYENGSEKLSTGGYLFFLQANRSIWKNGYRKRPSKQTANR